MKVYETSLTSPPHEDESHQFSTFTFGVVGFALLFVIWILVFQHFSAPMLVLPVLYVAGFGWFWTKTNHASVLDEGPLTRLLDHYGLDAHESAQVIRRLRKLRPYDEVLKDHEVANAIRNRMKFRLWLIKGKRRKKKLRLLQPQKVAQVAEKD